MCACVQEFLCVKASVCKSVRVQKHLYLCGNRFLCACLCLRDFQHICIFVMFTSSTHQNFVCHLQRKPWHVHNLLSWHLHKMNIFTWSLKTHFHEWTYSYKALASANHTATQNYLYIFLLSGPPSSSGDTSFSATAISVTVCHISWP